MNRFQHNVFFILQIYCLKNLGWGVFSYLGYKTPKYISVYTNINQSTKNINIVISTLTPTIMWTVGISRD